MQELMRFRIARAAERRVGDELSTLRPTPSDAWYPLLGSPDLRAAAAALLLENGLDRPRRTFFDSTGANETRLGG